MTSLQRIFNTRLKNCRLLFSVVISEHFSKSRIIISVVVAKIWYLKNVRFLLGHPVSVIQVTSSIVVDEKFCQLSGVMNNIFKVCKDCIS